MRLPLFASGRPLTNGDIRIRMDLCMITHVAYDFTGNGWPDLVVGDEDGRVALVEPARWYTHCDRVGILVWQDMPNGDHHPEWQRQQYFDGIEWELSPESEDNYRKEWIEIMDYLYSYPSIVTWIPFNERWGQFKTEEITEWTQQHDPSRLVLPASGGNHFQTGDMLGIHNYPQPILYLYDAQRPTVLSEFGGIGLAMTDHLWEPKTNWGYVQFST